MSPWKHRCLKTKGLISVVKILHGNFNWDPNFIKTILSDQHFCVTFPWAALDNES